VGGTSGSAEGIVARGPVLSIAREREPVRIQDAVTPISSPVTVTIGYKYVKVSHPGWLVYRESFTTFPLIVTTTSFM